MKFLIELTRKLKSFFNMNNQIPRKPNNKFEIDFSKIDSILIVQDDDGIAQYVIASGGEKNRDFYFEKYTPELGNLLVGHNDRAFVFSMIVDQIKKGENAISLIAHIKNLMK